MSFYQQLQEQTADERDALVANQMIARSLQGDVDVDDYVKFLSQAYHHVKHTVPLMMSVGARLPEDKEWLCVAVAEYIEEEIGHQEWILNDIAACGYDKEAVRNSKPNFETEMMVSYAYDVVNRLNPVGFFGMVLVLEGTSVALATQAAGALQQRLGLPAQCFTYLTSHGSLDISHMEHFRTLMDRITEPEDQQAIVHCARRMYRLYGDIFRGLAAAVTH